MWSTNDRYTFQKEIKLSSTRKLQYLFLEKKLLCQKLNMKQYQYRPIVSVWEVPRSIFPSHFSFLSSRYKYDYNRVISKMADLIKKGNEVGCRGSRASLHQSKHSCVKPFRWGTQRRVWTLSLSPLSHTVLEVTLGGLNSLCRRSHGPEETDSVFKVLKHGKLVEAMPSAGDRVW